MKKTTQSCFLLIILLTRIVPSLSSTVNYTDPTLEPVVTENSIIRQKIIDSQFKCYERMNRAPPYKKKERASKYCDETGNWFRHPESNRTWSNYTLCNSFTSEKLKMAFILYYMAIVGHALSITSLLISLAIFFYFKSLSCQRITLHKNLFFSYVLNSMFTIAHLIAVVPNPGLVKRDPDLSGSETMEKKDLSPGGHTRNEETMDKAQRHLNKNKQGMCMNTDLHILKILTALSELELH
ncbi:hypothetical protein DV515_00001524 [Chloebia gouldiae]|uniref:G-protein coupled receptors family 2 profile 1 domain-containing protein n=1 Tax=Chloebia gouldiae TaxID=44316 RepID=A0A3L8SZ74_CHLGU|nr:hypothetical protein DV515_00001524 [Chloebia gouldiae]